MAYELKGKALSRQLNHHRSSANPPQQARAPQKTKTRNTLALRGRYSEGAGAGGDTFRLGAQPDTTSRSPAPGPAPKSTRCLSSCPDLRPFTRPARSIPSQAALRPRARRFRVNDFSLKRTCPRWNPIHTDPHLPPATSGADASVPLARAREAGSRWCRSGSSTTLPSVPGPRPGIWRYLPCVSQSESQSQTFGGTRAKGRAPRRWRRERCEPNTPMMRSQCGRVRKVAARIKWW
ncbi:uncharacterized protein LOC129056107 [Pongo abelii]|uniref:uncharacterized protein LOC129056107 n=1 Tax=Pongo abelii TaxID=9601 RepID=UPI0023E84E85|nr:uncharacterized protein LOC129056107 [Pongo abelii]